MELLVPILVAISSMVVIMLSAGYAISSISHYAKQTGISKYLIGFLVVSIGTSLPELNTAIFAGLANQGSLVLGNVMGANIIDLSVVLGLTLLIGKKIVIKEKTINKTIYTALFMILLPLALGIDGAYSRVDGLILILLFLIYLVILIQKEGKLGKIKKQVKFKNIWKDGLIFSLALVALLLSAYWLVLSTLQIGTILNLPAYFMGLIFVAVGTTIPELTVEIRSVLKGSSALAFGDIIGSSIVNFNLVLGIACLISPFTIDSTSSFLKAAVFVLIASLGVVFVMRKKVLTWKHGLGFLAIYIVFLLSQLV